MRTLRCASEATENLAVAMPGPAFEPVLKRPLFLLVEPERLMCNICLNEVCIIVCHGVPSILWLMLMVNNLFDHNLICFWHDFYYLVRFSAVVKKWKYTVNSVWKYIVFLWKYYWIWKYHCENTISKEMLFSRTKVPAKKLVIFCLCTKI